VKILFLLVSKQERVMSAQGCYWREFREEDWTINFQSLLFIQDSRITMFLNIDGQ
jgi:hypothetical protein